MGEIVVNFAALSQASADITKALTGMHGELSGLEQGIKPLLAQWDGDAKAEYEQRQREWTSASNDLARLLKDIQIAVDKSAEIMLARERTNKGKFGG